MSEAVKPYQTSPDHDGAWLEVRDCGQGSHGYVSVTDEHGALAEACVLPEEIPGLAAALYRAAGMEPPPGVTGA